MTITSLTMAVQNLTQVEHLGIKDRIHTLAILKPLTEELLRINPNIPAHIPWHEVIYNNKVYAILQLDQGVNPWDLGSWGKNLGSVMGKNVLEWVLPIRRSPCCKEMEFGPAVEELRRRVNFRR